MDKTAKAIQKMECFKQTKINKKHLFIVDGLGGSRQPTSHGLLFTLYKGKVMDEN